MVRDQEQIVPSTRFGYPTRRSPPPWDCAEKQSPLTCRGAIARCTRTQISLRQVVRDTHWLGSLSPAVEHGLALLDEGFDGLAMILGLRASGLIEGFHVEDSLKITGLGGM